MRIPRIYHPDPIQVSVNTHLNADASNHLARVLRFQVGAKITLFNGDGFNYDAEIIDANKKAVEVIIHNGQKNTSESPLNIHLGQVISRGDRMDFTLQKSVELGVTEITPLISERCGVKLSQERFEKKIEQWQKIVVSACEQSGRSFVPKVNPVTALSDWSNKPFDGTSINLHPNAEIGFKQLSISNNQVRLLIGPEGGLSDNEITQSRIQGFTDILMGSRVLRTETASLAAISMLQALYGDLG